MSRAESSDDGFDLSNSEPDTYEAQNELPPDTSGKACRYCGKAGHEHEKERVYPDDGPAGAYHYRYLCPQ